MVVHQALNKRYVRLSSLLEAELSAVRLDPSQGLSTLDQDLGGILVESFLVVNPDPKDLMAVQNRDRSDVGFFDSLEDWKQGALFFRQHSLDRLVSFLNRYQDSTHP
jgi:ferric-dicitrate binding protein FerR (iron transport regulator)